MDQGVKSGLSWRWVLMHRRMMWVYPINSIYNRTHAIDAHNQMPNSLTYIFWNTMIIQQMTMVIRGIIIIIHNIIMSHPKMSYEITEDRATIQNKDIFRHGITRGVFISLLLALSCNMLQWCYLCCSWFFTSHVFFFFGIFFFYLLKKSHKTLSCLFPSLTWSVMLVMCDSN